MFSKRLAAAVLIGVLFIVCSGGPDEREISDFTVLLERALSLSQEQYDEIWSGYNLNDYAIALYNDREAFLVNHPDPGEDFSETGKTLAGHPLFHADKKIPEFIANTSIDYRGTTTAIFVVSPDMTDQGFYNLLFHEVFHSFARSVEAIQGRSGNLLLLPFFPGDDAEYYSLSFIAQQILKDACAGGDDEAVRELAGQYLAVDDRRTQCADLTFAGYESEEQINEGLAEYAGNRGLALMGYSAESRENLDKKLDLKPDGPPAFRLRCYGTGHALALLLDRFRPGWKTELTRDKSLAGLLQEKVPPAQIADMQDYLAGRGIQTLCGEYTGILAAYRDESLGQFSSITENPHITVRFPDASFARMYFDPMNIRSVADAVLYHGRFVKLFNEDAGFDLTMNAPALTDFVSGNLFMVESVRFGLPVSMTAVIDGEDAAVLPESADFESLTLNADGIALTAGSGSIRKQGNSFEIALKYGVR